MTCKSATCSTWESPLFSSPYAADDDEPPVHRRIDIKVYETDAFPTALLYFTGSDKFNRSMRLWAKRKGYALQDKGLFRDRSEAAASRGVRGSRRKRHLRRITIGLRRPER